MVVETGVGGDDAVLVIEVKTVECVTKFCDEALPVGVENRVEYANGSLSVDAEEGDERGQWLGDWRRWLVLRM